MTLSLRYIDSAGCIFFGAKMKKGNKERKKKLILARKIKTEKKNERDENENYYLLW